MVPGVMSGNLKYSGCIEVITGSMFSGKTEELIRRVKRAKLANQRVKIFKSSTDTRYSKNEVVSHDATSMDSTIVTMSSEILKLAGDIEVIGIDEAQFFDSELIVVCETLANIGRRVIVAGLDMDFKGKPFGPLPQLMAIAENVTKLQAVCMSCGNPALYSHRKSSEEKQVLLGEQQIYEPLCRVCYNKVMQK